MFKFQRFHALKLKLKPLGNILKRRRFKLLSSQEVPCIKNCSFQIPYLAKQLILTKTPLVLGTCKRRRFKIFPRGFSGELRALGVVFIAFLGFFL